MKTLQRERDVIKPRLPTLHTTPRWIKPWSSIGSGTTVNTDIAFAKEFPMGIRDPTLGEHRSQTVRVDEKDDHERPYFYRSFQPMSERGILDKQFVALRSGVSFCLTRAFAAFNLKYRSKYLDLNDTQTYIDLSESVYSTRQMIRLFYTHLPNKHLEIAVLGHLLLQHRVMILYEYDDAQRKVNAKNSFPDDIVGKWNFPTGDLLIIPRPAPKSGFPVVVWLEDAAKVWINTARLAGSYSEKMVPRCQLDKNFQLMHIKEGLVFNKALRLTQQFKPVFFPVYFEPEDRSKVLPKKAMTLKLVEKICLAAEHLCDSALVCKQMGSAFSLAQRAKMCCTLMDLLLDTPLLSDHRCYTHLMANWQLGNASFFFFLHMNFNHLYVARQYEAMSAAFNIFPEVVRSFEREFSQVWNTQMESLLRYPNSLEVVLEIGLQAFQELRPPGRWTRSHYRAYAMAALLDFHRLRRWTVQISAHGGLCVTSQEFMEAESRIPSDCLLAPLRDMAVLGRLVDARAQRYRANVIDAEALFSEDPSQNDGPYEVSLRFVPERSRAHNPAWDEMMVSLGSAGRSLQCAAAVGGKLWLRVFLRVAVERSSALLAKVQNSVTFSKEIPAALVLQAVHSMCCVASVCSQTLRSLKTENRRVYEEMRSTFTVVVCLHCRALSSAYLYWFRCATDLGDEEKLLLLRTARYYHALGVLGIFDRTVALALINHHVTELQLAKEVLEKGRELLPYPKDIRRRLHILRRCVDMLPLLWEYSIFTSIDGPSRCEEVTVSEKILPITIGQMREMLPESCEDGYNFIHQLFRSLPNFLPVDCPAHDVELSNSATMKRIKSQISIIDGAGKLQMRDDDVINTIVKAVENIVFCFYTESQDQNSLDVRNTVAKAALLMAKLSLSTVKNGLKFVDFALQLSTIELTLSLLSIIFAVIGVENSSKLTDRLFLDISSKFLNSLTLYIITLPSGLRGDCDHVAMESQYELNCSDITSFFLAVPAASIILGFGFDTDISNLLTQLEQCLRSLVYHTAVVLQETDDPSYFLLSCEIVKLTKVLHFLITHSETAEGKNQLELHSSISKYLLLSLVRTVNRQPVEEAWCAAALDIMKFSGRNDIINQKELWLNPKLDAEHLFPQKTDRFSFVEVPSALILDNPPVNEIDVLSNIPGPTTTQVEPEEVDLNYSHESSSLTGSSSSESIESSSEYSSSLNTHPSLATCSLKGSLKSHKSVHSNKSSASDPAGRTELSARAASELIFEFKKFNEKQSEKPNKATELHGNLTGEAGNSKNIAADDTDKQEIFLPGINHALLYDPFHNLDQFIEEEEKGCLRFELFSLTSQFSDVTGNFFLQPQSTNLQNALDEVLQILTGAVSGCVASIQKATNRGAYDKVTLTGLNDNDVTISSDTADQLCRVRKRLSENYKRNPSLAITQALFCIDRDIFGGSMAPILRGIIDSTFELGSVSRLV